MSSSFKVPDYIPSRPLQFNPSSETEPSVTEKTDARITGIIAPLIRPLGADIDVDLGLDLDVYPGSMLTFTAINLEDTDPANADPEQEFKAMVKGYNNFAKLFLKVQLTNIASGAEITAAVEEAQKLLVEAQADFSQYLKLNATIKSMSAKLNMQIRDDEMRIKYKEMSSELRDAAELQEKIAIATMAAGAAMVAAGLALMAACGAGTPLVVAGGLMIAAGALQLADAEIKLKAINQMDVMLNDTSKPLDEVALRSLATRGQVGLSDNLAFKIINFVVALASAISSGGANINSVLTVIGYVADLADMIANEASDDYHDAKPNDDDDLNRMKKAMKYLKKLTGGVAGAVNIVLEVILVEITQRLLYGMGDDDKRTAEEKHVWEIIQMILEIATTVGMAVAGGMAASGKGGSVNKAFFGNSFMADLDAKTGKAAWVATMVVKSGLNIVQTVANGFRELGLAAVDTSKAALTAILTKLKSALELLAKLSNLKDQLTQDQQKMLEDAQTALAADINDLIKTIKGMLDNMNTAISNTSY